MAEQLVEQRRICWPDPDATCVEGGCLYCSEGRWMNINRVRAYCERLSHQSKTLTHRGNGKAVSPMEAFAYGRSHGWGNAPTRTQPRGPINPPTEGGT